ncbi:GNAT family N-acetyltransferase [Nocardioides bruguierae]|uniref:GNAT family N-acetyltransferase n=1 Tax=Nocardioides bruguierae TaxID=2945102 RepID=A0A9X2D6U1_9ACTN|nr:GNAT family N-acetyltransferase [Nocardioides bruguierae]MCL8023965.1 GNAT family N-acetyltransferase [Nocardioides bruguierae]MCM0620370.1 GNAT family N-acetyltransferase [Nocardioides bruguierae]
MSTEPVLRSLTVDDEAAVRAAHSELSADDFTFLLEIGEDEPWADFVERLPTLRTDPPAGRVPAEFLVLVVDGEIAGRVSIRYELNDWLTRWGGHVGYGVRPGFRRRGYASLMLTSALQRLAEAGVEQALVTCDDGNLGSAAVILGCGGVLEDVVPGPEDDPTPKRRYWVPTTR